MLNKKILSNYIKPLAPEPTHLEQRGEPKEKIECILFDVYGTLFVSGSGDISIAQKSSEGSAVIDTLLKKYAIPESSHDVLPAFFEAIGRRHDTLRKEGIDSPEVEIDDIWSEVLKLNDMEKVRDFSIEYELIANPVYPMPHLSEMITTLSQKKILMGIISNAQFFTPELFQWFLGNYPEHLGFHPDLLFYSYKYQQAKPSLYLYRAAQEKLKVLGFSPSSVLYIGNDMLNDIYPARQLGFQTALFAGDRRSLRLRSDDERCKNISPDLVITDLIQLIDFF